jgi:hypothetical protein
MNNNTIITHTSYRLWNLTDRTFFNRINDAGGAEIRDEIHSKIDGGTQHSVRAGAAVNSIDIGPLTDI